MSLIIIPLAGPDFYTEKFGIRPLYPLGDTTLIEHVISNRFWVNHTDEGNQIVFVLLDVGAPTKTMQDFIAKKFPTARCVILSNVSSGAPFSALAGLALSNEFNTSVIVDLADIGFSLSINVEAYFASYPKVMGLIPYFESLSTKFSYLRIEGGKVLEAREKELISNYASAGVYIFRNVHAYLEAILFSLCNPSKCTKNNIFYVCPMLNGLISDHQEVHAIAVDNVEPLGQLFH
jgi:hypothetical protein